MSLFDSLANITLGIAKVVLAPVEIVAAVAEAALEPIVEAAEDIVKDLKS